MHKIKLFVTALFAIGFVACAAQQKTNIATIGKQMNQQDKINAKHAMITVPIGQEAVWVNPKTKTSYTVRPIKQYQKGKTTCRQVMLLANGQQKVSSNICCGPDGKWRIAS